MAMLYRLLKLIVTIGIRLYYREIRVSNRQNLEENGPLILIANHPNTLMDAWIMGYINKRRIHYMAKATFFSTPLKRFFLNALGMIPINRKSDAAVKGVENKDSFEACYQLLEHGEVLTVFPEGTSFAERRLRELKSGTARIALEAESRNNASLGLKVIPVGLNYVRGDSFRGSVHVIVGKPIEIADLVNDYRQHAGLAAKKLTERFRTELSRVFITLANDEREQLVQELTWLFNTRYTSDSGVKGTISTLKDFRDRLEELEISEPWKEAEIRKQADELRNSLQLYAIRPDFLDRPYRATMFVRQTLLSYFFLLLTIPVFVAGFIANVLPYSLIGKLVPRLTKEVEYHAPMSVLLGMALYPLTYAGWCLLARFLFHPAFSIQLVFFFSLPFLGLYAHFYLRYLRHLFSKQHFSHFANARKNLFAALKAKRQALQELLYE